jgi:hypothetical protein
LKHHNVGWVTLLDAQSLQFAVPPALQRREEAAGRKQPTTADVNAVLVSLHPGVAAAGVAEEIERWKHLSAVTDQQQEEYLTKWLAGHSFSRAQPRQRKTAAASIPARHARCLLTRPGHQPLAARSPGLDPHTPLLPIGFPLRCLHRHAPI